LEYELPESPLPLAMLLFHVPYSMRDAREFMTERVSSAAQRLSNRAWIHVLAHAECLFKGYLLRSKRNVLSVQFFNREANDTIYPSLERLLGAKDANTASKYYQELLETVVDTKTRENTQIVQAVARELEDSLYGLRSGAEVPSEVARKVHKILLQPRLQQSANQEIASAPLVIRAATESIERLTAFVDSENWEKHVRDCMWKIATALVKPEALPADEQVKFHDYNPATAIQLFFSSVERGKQQATVR
jgi:hypothetical protein